MDVLVTVMFIVGAVGVVWMIFGWLDEKRRRSADEIANRLREATRFDRLENRKDKRK